LDLLIVIAVFQLRY